eukprot:jgi/Mesen1/5925/ME000030S05182
MLRSFGSRRHSSQIRSFFCAHPWPGIKLDEVGALLATVSPHKSFAFFSTFGGDPPVHVGEVKSLERVFTREDVAEYAKLGGDSNPIHVDDMAAREAGFKGAIVHGILYGGLFSTLIGAEYPGAVYLSQSLSFRAPVPVGGTVRAQIEVTSVVPHRQCYR